MIKVLHLCPPDNTMIAQYADMVCKGMPDGVTCSMSNDARQAAAFCKESRPDILHLHGYSDAAQQKVAESARRTGIRIILSPHGHLHAWHRSAATTPSLHLVSHAYAIIAQSHMEADALAKLGRSSRIETIPNPIITKTTTASHMVGQLLTVYRKVMASDMLALMDKPTRTALRLLLKAGITGDRRWLETIDLGQPDWQRLYLYAEYEGISETLFSGIKVLGADAPSPVAQPIYLPHGYQKPEPSPQQEVMPLMQTIQDETDSKQLSLLRLVELDTALRFQSLDEDVLMQELDAAGMKPLFACILQILKEQTGLDEGFMPCEPTDNSTTEEIRNTINNHLRI